MALRAPKDSLFAGGIFVAIGAGFALESLNYELGTLFRMGPGFAPLALGTILLGLGLAIGLTAFRQGEDAEHLPVPWRAILFVVAAIVLFGFCIRGLGFVPTTFATASLAIFASRTTKPLGGLLVAAALTLLSTLVFVYGLRLQVPLVGPWLQFA